MLKKILAFTVCLLCLYNVVIGMQKDEVGGILHCPYDVTDEDLIVVAQENPDIVSINLSGCRRISIDGVKILAKLCKKLKSISLYDLPDHDGDGIDPYGFSVSNFEKKHPNIEIIKRSPQEFEWERIQKEHEEKVRKIKEAQEAEEQRRKKRIQDILGDDDH